MMTQFKQGVCDGTMQCIQKSATYENNRIVGSWMPERFGQTGCYHGMFAFMVSHLPIFFVSIHWFYY